MNEITDSSCVCDIGICLQELVHTCKMFDNAGVPHKACSYGTTTGVACNREHITSLTQFSDLKKFQKLIAQVEGIAKEAKGVKAQQLGKQLVLHLKARIVPSTAQGAAKGTMMVNTK